MRWCYKTVHFAMKKEGFLGSAFLDEAEVEQSLNEYGQSGWELTSIIETQDGLIAFFKQPLGAREKFHQEHREKEEATPASQQDEPMVPSKVYRREEQQHEESPSENDDVDSIRIE